MLKKFTDARNIQQIKDVCLKKDQHPAIHAEWRRMFMAEKEERDKPENVGSNIVFDKKKRILLKDNVVNDRSIKQTILFKADIICLNEKNMYYVQLTWIFYIFKQR